MMGLLPDIAKDFQISIPTAGHLISAYAAGVVIGAPLLVAISGNFGPKKILLALMAIFTLFNGLSAIARATQPCSSFGCWPVFPMARSSASAR